MTRTIGMRTALVAIAALVVAPLAACTSRTAEDTSPAETIQLAASRTRDAGSSKFQVTIEMRGLPQVDDLRMIGEGAFDYDARKGHMTMELPDPSGASRSLSMTSVFDGSVLYMKMPQMAQAAPGGKPWFRLDLEQAGELSGVDLSGFSQVEQSDPTQYLNYLRATSEDAREVGTEQVRGVETTRYSGTVNLDRVVEEAPAARASVEGLKDFLADEPMRMDAWIDDDGLARRIRTAFSIRDPAGGQGADITTTFELFDFGTEVTIDVPPEDQVTDMTEFLRQRGD